MNITIASTTTPTFTGNQLLAEVELEWAHAAAPGASETMYVGNVADGGSAIAIGNAIATAVGENACSTIGIGYVFCGAIPGFYQALDDQYAQGVVQKQSIMSTTGDYGAAATAVNPGHPGMRTGTWRGNQRGCRFYQRHRNRLYPIHAKIRLFGQ